MYIHKTPILVPTSVAAITSTGVAARYLVTRQMNVNLLAFAVSTTLSSTGSSVITFLYRPVIGATTNQVTLGTITIPTAVAAGAFYYNNIKNVVCPPGGELVINVTTAASSAGGGQGFFGGDEDPEVLPNISAATLVTA